MLKGLFFIAIFSFLVGCSTTDDISGESPEKIYEKALKLEKDERFEEALLNFSEIRNKYPYSKLSIESELHIADINFRRESYPEAESAYKLFKEFHPKHELSPFITFRIAMSIFKQLPDSIDRDLALAQDAIMYFDQVITNYPESDYAGSAKDHKQKCLVKLARKDTYIADFYFKRDKYDSALGRYEEILLAYQNIGFEARSLYGAAYSAYKIEEKAKAKKYYQRLQAEYGNTKWAEKAKEELERKL